MYVFLIYWNITDGRQNRSKFVYGDFNYERAGI